MEATNVADAQPNKNMQQRIAHYVVVACIASATLGLELVQTRILSALYYNHVVYLTVTIALMGFGISGVLVSLYARKLQSPEKAVAFFAAAFAISIFVCLRLASFIPKVFPFHPTLFKLTLSYAILVIPFLFSGAALGTIFMTQGRNIYRLYFTDLAASATAVLLFGLLLWPLGAERFAWLCALVALLGYLTQGKLGKIATSSMLFIACAFALGLLFWGNRLLSEQPELYKTAGKIYTPNWTTGRVEATEWTPIAKIDVLYDPQRDLVSGNYSVTAPNQRMITQDFDAHTLIWSPARIEQALRKAKNGDLIEALSLTYFLRPNADQSLIIGVGGGKDIVVARAHGARHITGVEINPATIELVTQRYRDFAVWPSWNNVEIKRAEGRHFVRGTPEKFETIVMSGVDTFSALNSGAYILSENYLYTVDAIEDYLKALKPDGIMAIYRWFFQQPRESLRLANLFLSASERLHIKQPDASIMVLASGRGENRWAATLIKKTPFTSKEVQLVLDKIATDPLLAPVYLPKVFPQGEQAQIESAAFQRDAKGLSLARQAYRNLIAAKPGAERSSFEQQYPYKISPVFDDRPFFFEYYKGATASIDGRFRFENVRGAVVYYSLYILLIVTGIVSFLAMIGPLMIFEREGLNIARVRSLLAFFASLGIGFMLVEIGLMQWLNLYLGDPMLSLMVVLAGLLLFTGAGSYVAGRLSWNFAKVLTVGMIGVALAVPLWLLAMHFVLPATELWPLAARIGVALASLLPLGLLMGLPFATGIRYLEERYRRFIPWAWGINGLTSVMASIIAVSLAMRIGFTMVVLLGGLVYVLGLLAIRFHMAGGKVRMYAAIATS
jgi:hypothetical protein